MKLKCERYVFGKVGKGGSMRLKEGTEEGTGAVKILFVYYIY